MSEDSVNKSINQLSIGQYNLANNTKWIFNIPLSRLFYAEKIAANNDSDTEYLDYPLLCKGITFPDFSIGSAPVSFGGYSFDVSTRQNVTKKTLGIKFLISENWLQYLMLLKWFSLEDYTRYNNKDDNTIEIDGGNGTTQTTDAYDYKKAMAESGKYPYYSTQGPIVPTELYLMDNFDNRICTIKFISCWLSNLKNVSLDYEKTNNTEAESEFELNFYKYEVVINNNELKKFITSNINTD